VIPEIIKRYVDTGKARFVSREFPLTSIHPLAQKAAEAVVCAGKQDRYFEMHDKLFANQSEWTASGADPIKLYGGYATEIGLDTAAFNTCLDSGEAATAVKGDMLAGEQLGVSATPYFFIDKIPIRGGLSVEGFSAIIDYVLAGGSNVEIVPVGNWRALGSTQTAKAAAVAFVDYADSKSRQFALEVLPQLRQTYIDTGQMLFVIHPWTSAKDTPSAYGAAAAECASQQGKGWEMYTKLFEEQSKWTQAANPQPLFTSYAQGLGLDTAKFEQCLSSPETAVAVQGGSVVAMMYGVPGAQTYLFNNSQSLSDSPTFEEFKTIIDSIVNQ
jgi:protein-disulfide isomerase